MASVSLPRNTTPVVTFNTVRESARLIRTIVLPVYQSKKRQPVSSINLRCVTTETHRSSSPKDENFNRQSVTFGQIFVHGKE